jgi:hypothetical protein
VADPSSERFGELVRAHAYAQLQTLTEDERARWEALRAALSRELGVDSPAPDESVSARVWSITLESLRQLRPALQDGPGWLTDRYAQEERRRLDAYAEAHVDVLRALARRRSE